MNSNGIKLRLALSLNGSILCTAHNRTAEDLSILHSAVHHHTDLFVYNQDGKSVDFADRALLQASTSRRDTDGAPIIVPGDGQVHLSHSRIIFNSDGLWGVTWGRMRYTGLESGVYYFVASHKETMSSNLAIFDICPESSEKSTAEISPEEYWPKGFTHTRNISRADLRK